MRTRFVIAVMAILSASPALRAEVQSGPAVDDAVPALEASAVTGDLAGKDLDLAKEREGKPTVYVFIQREHWSRPMARFLKTLDENVSKRGDDAQVVAVFLSDDAAAVKEYLPKAQNSIQLTDTTMAAFAGTSGPDGWGINADAHLTAVVTGGETVAATFGFRSVNETVVPDVEKALTEAAGK